MLIIHVPYLRRQAALTEVAYELNVMEVKLEAGIHHVDLSSPTTHIASKLPIIMEEVGEVAKAVNDGESNAALRKELAQVAACAIATMESLR